MPALRPFHQTYAFILAFTVLIPFSSAWAAKTESPEDLLEHVEEANLEATSYPAFSGEILFELQHDEFYKSDDPEKERHTTFTTVEPVFALNFTREFSVETAMVYEPVGEVNPRAYSAFSKQGLFVEMLFLRYAKDRFSIRGGKINPEFGLAWDMAPGIYGSELAELDYELTEMLGFGGSWNFGNAAVESLVLTANLFQADDTVLSESAIEPRYIYIDREGEVHKRNRAGYLSRANTGNLESFAITLRGEEIPAVPGLLFDLGYTRLAMPEPLTDQSWANASLTYAAPLTEEIDLSLLAEYVYKDNAFAIEDYQADYLTLGSELEWRGWNTALSFTGIDHDPAAGIERSNDTLFQVSAGYAFAFGLRVDLAWVRADLNDVVTDGVGALLAYTLSF